MQDAQNKPLFFLLIFVLFLKVSIAIQGNLWYHVTVQKGKEVKNMNDTLAKIAYKLILGKAGFENMSIETRRAQYIKCERDGRQYVFSPEQIRRIGTGELVIAHPLAD